MRAAPPGVTSSAFEQIPDAKTKASKDNTTKLKDEKPSTKGGIKKTIPKSDGVPSKPQVSVGNSSTARDLKSIGISTDVDVREPKASTSKAPTTEEAKPISVSKVEEGLSKNRLHTEKTETKQEGVPVMARLDRPFAEASMLSYGQLIDLPNARSQKEPSKPVLRGVLGSNASSVDTSQKHGQVSSELLPAQELDMQLDEYQKLGQVSSKSPAQRSDMRLVVAVGRSKRMGKLVENYGSNSSIPLGSTEAITLSQSNGGAAAAIPVHHPLIFQQILQSYDTHQNQSPKTSGEFSMPPSSGPIEALGDPIYSGWVPNDDVYGYQQDYSQFSGYEQYATVGPESLSQFPRAPSNLSMLSDTDNSVVSSSGIQSPPLPSLNQPPVSQTRQTHNIANTQNPSTSRQPVFSPRVGPQFIRHPQTNVGPASDSQRSSPSNEYLDQPHHTLENQHAQSHNLQTRFIQSALPPASSSTASKIRLTPNVDLQPTQQGSSAKPSTPRDVAVNHASSQEVGRSLTNENSTSAAKQAKKKLASRAPAVTQNDSHSSASRNLNVMTKPIPLAQEGESRHVSGTVSKKSKPPKTDAQPLDINNEREPDHTGGHTLAPVAKKSKLASFPPQRPQQVDPVRERAIDHPADSSQTKHHVLRQGSEHPKVLPRHPEVPHQANALHRDNPSIKKQSGVQADAHPPSEHAPLRNKSSNAPTKRHNKQTVDKPTLKGPKHGPPVKVNPTKGKSGKHTPTKGKGANHKPNKGKSINHKTTKARGERVKHDGQDREGVDDYGQSGQDDPEYENQDPEGSGFGKGGDDLDQDDENQDDENQDDENQDDENQDDENQDDENQDESRRFFL